MATVIHKGDTIQTTADIQAYYSYCGHNRPIIPKGSIGIVQFAYCEPVCGKRRYFHKVEFREIELHTLEGAVHAGEYKLIKKEGE